MYSSPKHRLVLVTLGVATMALLFPVIAQACAMCVGPEDDAYFWAILFLMLMPFTLGGSIGGWLLYTYWHAHGGGQTTLPTLHLGRLRKRASPSPAMAGHTSGDPMGDGQTHGTEAVVGTQKESAN